MVLSLVICVTAVLLELGAWLLLLRKSLWREYSFFFAYAVWLLIANTAILVTDLYFRPAYPSVYWYIDSIDVVLRFLVVWEVFHQIFPKGSGLNRSLSKGLADRCLWSSCARLCHILGLPALSWAPH